MSDFNQIVNSVIAWRQSLGDAYTTSDYVDFAAPRTAEELADIALTVNTTFNSFDSKMRVDSGFGGVIVPSVDCGPSEMIKQFNRDRGD